MGEFLRLSAGVIRQAVPLLAADGYRLVAHTFESEAPARAQLVMAGATGVPQGFYRRFASFAAQQGYPTLTFDYRGVGQSAPGHLRDFQADFLDWSRLDLAAAVDHATETSSLPTFLIGHSFGGHAFGLLPNHQKVSGLYCFGTGSGWHGFMPPLERLRVLVLWRIVAPILTAWKGYLPFKMLGMGEDLPLGVYRQWRHWCRYPHYFFDDPEMTQVADLFAQVRAPIVAANALDDRWAPPPSRDAFMQGYRNSHWHGLDLDPAHTGPLGHMGYFRAQAQPLWDQVLHWIDQQV